MRKPFINVPGGMPGNITPQGKIIDVADKIGNVGIKKMQGTSRMIYDSLPITAAVNYNFYEGASSRTFPFTNLDSNGGKLGVGETMVIQRAYLVFFSFTELAGVGAVDDINSFPNFQMGEIEIVQNNQRILKRAKLSSFTTDFNHMARTAEQTVFHFDTYLTLQPELEFNANIRVPFSVAVENSFVQLVLEGAGSIASTKQNF